MTVSAPVLSDFFKPSIGKLQSDGMSQGDNTSEGNRLRQAQQLARCMVPLENARYIRKKPHRLLWGFEFLRETCHQGDGDAGGGLASLVQLSARQIVPLK
jgi:hypothetical protein